MRRSARFSFWPPTLTLLSLLALSSPSIAQNPPISFDTPDAPLAAWSASPKDDDDACDRTQLPLAQRLVAPFWQIDDPDGPISTDRPTFTPANTVLPLDRFQIESGYTFTHDLNADTRTNRNAYPELSTRVGILPRVEFRTYWIGQANIRETNRTTGLSQIRNGTTDMEVGFKTQLISQDRDEKWLPTTALITSVLTPVGEGLTNSSGTVRPYIDLLYGWNLTDRLTVTGSLGYRQIRRVFTNQPADSLERFNQSLVASFKATDRLTLFQEWYALTYTNAADNRPIHFIDTGFLYRPTPNTQLDLRAGMGLGDRPDDFFTGAGFSIRY